MIDETPPVTPEARINLANKLSEIAADHGTDLPSGSREKYDVYAIIWLTNTL